MAAINIEASTKQNSYFRRVIYTTKNMQLVLMSLKPGEEIGLEAHPVDQFFRVEAGTGIARLGETNFLLSDSAALIIPGGMKHNIVNTSKTDDLKLYTIYSPPQHPNDTIEISKSKS